MAQDPFLEKLDQRQIVEAIREAERRCSGEIRVHVQRRCFSRDVRWFAERTFERLGMTKTANRNGVLLFIASEERRFAIIGDEGIHERVGQSFWEETAAKMTSAFAAGRFTEGIVQTVELAGALLAEHFPRGADDVDELSDEISTGDEDEA